MTEVPPEDIGRHGNAKHRWQYRSFSFGGDAPDSAYGRGYEATFGKAPPKYCPECEKSWSWCECKKDDKKEEPTDE